MAMLAFAAPILPGKEQAHKDFIQEATGPRRSEYEASRRRLGMTREAIWHQQTPQGVLAIIVIEADDPENALQQMGGSDDPFDQWFREQALAIHGVLWGTAEQVFDDRFS